MSIFTEIHEQISAILLTLDFTPVSVPEDLADLPAVEAIMQRLRPLVADLGGYSALAAALPMHTAGIWKNKIDGNGHNKLMLEDFESLIGLFNDSVLIALFAGDHGFNTIDVRSIPRSDHSLADLVWALRRYQAQGQLLACEFRDNMMEGLPTGIVKSRIAQNAKESIVLAKQIELALEDLASTS